MTILIKAMTTCIVPNNQHINNNYIFDQTPYLKHVKFFLLNKENFVTK